MRTIVLPRLAGTRELARTLVHEAATSNGDDCDAVLSARAVDVAATSFVDELVRELKASGTKRVVVQGASEDFLGSMQDRASIHGGIVVEKRAA